MMASSHTVAPAQRGLLAALKKSGGFRLPILVEASDVATIRSRRPRHLHRCFSSSKKKTYDPQQIKQDHAHCVNLVKDRDREGYLCGLLMPTEAQKSYFAVRSLNVELASIKDAFHLRRAGQPVEHSQSGAGAALMDNSPTTLALQMRMQWWREALDEIYDSSADDDSETAASKQRQNSPLGRSLSISCWHSPVVRALHAANQRSNLTRRFLERLIDAREADLDLNQYGSMEECVAYAEETVSSLLYLNLECTGVRDDAADEVAWHAGIGIGLVTALRATPFRLQHGEIPLPASLFPSHFPYDELVRAMSSGSSNQRNEGDDQQQLEPVITLTEANGKIWDEAVRHMAEHASGHLVRAQELQSRVPRNGRAALLPVVPALLYLSQLQQDADYNLFDPALHDPSAGKRLNLLLLLGRTWLTGIF